MGKYQDIVDISLFDGIVGPSQGRRFDSCQGPKVAFFAAVPLNNFHLQHPSNVNSNAF
jgi:hypothetical protein